MMTASDMGKKSWEVRKKKYGNSLMKRMSDLASKKRSEKAQELKTRLNDTERSS